MYLCVWMCVWNGTWLCVRSLSLSLCFRGARNPRTHAIHAHADAVCVLLGVVVYCCYRFFPLAIFFSLLLRLVFLSDKNKNKMKCFRIAVVVSFMLKQNKKKTFSLALARLCTQVHLVVYVCGTYSIIPARVVGWSVNGVKLVTYLRHTHTLRRNTYLLLFLLSLGICTRARKIIIIPRWTESPAETHRSLLGAQCSLIASNWSVICSSWHWLYVRRTNQFDCHSFVVFLNSLFDCDGSGCLWFVLFKKMLFAYPPVFTKTTSPLPAPLLLLSLSSESRYREPLRLVSWFTRSTRPIEFFECEDFSSSEKIEKFLKPIPITHLLVMILLV